MAEEHRGTREKLLEAATPLFARDGYDAVSIRDIATAADVNVAAINYHFQGKENLYREVLHEVVSSKRDAYAEAMARVTAEHPGDLEAIIRSFFRLHFEDTLKTDGGPRFLQLFVRELHHGQPRNTKIIADLLIPVWQDLGTNLLAAVPGADPAMAPWLVGSLHGQLVHFTMRWYKAHCDGLADCNNHADCPPPTNPIAQIFPALSADIDTYIDEAVEHITRFSAAGIRACLEVTCEQPNEGDHS